MSENKLDEEKDIDLVAVIHNYLRHWKMFLISFFICMTGVILYLVVDSPEFGVSAKILINEESKAPGSDLLDAFSDMGVGMQTSKNIENESEILKSRLLMNLVSDSLNLRVNYFSKNQIRKIDLYKKSPIIVKFKGFNIYENVTFAVNYDAAQDLLSIKSKDLNLDTKVKWGDTITTPDGTFAIYKNPKGAPDYPLNVKIKAIQLIPLVGVDPTSKYSSVLELSLKDSNPIKAVDIINTLIYFYNNENLKFKNIVAHNTINFINSRLQVISAELDSVERGVEIYKKVNKLTDPIADGTADIKTNSAFADKIADVDVQLSLLASMKSYIVDKKNKDKIVPSTLGIEDKTLIALMSGFNTLQLEKAQMTQGMKPGNPVLENYQNQTETMRQNLLEAINSYEKGARAAHSELKLQGGLGETKISDLATQEREYRELARQQKVKETLYVFLLQKKEENNLLLRSVVPRSKMVDGTFVDPKPVSPQKMTLLLIGLLFSILIPAAILYLKDVLSFKLTSKDELEKLTHIPLLGEIPIRKNQSFLKPGESGSVLAEQFRLNATNITFMLPPKGCKKVMITSTLSGEGKTFYATNLAISLANVGKRVLLINLDIHKEDITFLLHVTHKKGVTNYLADINENLDDMIISSKEYEGLSILPAGHVPPNPGLLLMSPRLEELFATVQDQYDYLIIDTPPVGLIADAMMLNKYANLTIYILRANYTPKSAVKNLNAMNKANQLKNLSIVLNGGASKSNYGKYYNKYYKK